MLWRHIGELTCKVHNHSRARCVVVSAGEIGIATESAHVVVMGGYHLKCISFAGNDTYNIMCDVSVF